MNGEIRDREKVTRNLKSVDSPVLKGLQIYHNYIRPHMSLGEKTPSELAGIKVNGENKWLTLIQNASEEEKNKRLKLSSVLQEDCVHKSIFEICTSDMRDMPISAFTIKSFNLFIDVVC